jgi:hypothetical protein
MMSSRSLFKVFWFLAIATAVTLHCDKIFDVPFVSRSVYYYNSFESATDTLRWNGVSVGMFVDDPAPNSGNRSLQIGGGCIQPTAWITLPETKEEGRFKLSCWGKVDQPSQSGGVLLYVDGEMYYSPVAEIRIKDRDWTYYESDTCISCPKVKRLRVELMIGGIIFASMHVDGLSVEAVEN